MALLVSAGEPSGLKESCWQCDCQAAPDSRGKSLDEAAKQAIYSTFSSPRDADDSHCPQRAVFDALLILFYNWLDYPASSRGAAPPHSWCRGPEIKKAIDC
jgi:hypothetical protein